MKAIKYTAGTLEKIDENYYNIVLFNNGKQVYKGLLTRVEASQIMFKSNKIKLIK